MVDQPENYTQIENELLKHLMKWRLAPNQWQVALCILRKTNGFHKDIDYIPNWQISEDTELCKEVVSRVLKDLETMKIIIRQGKNVGINKDVSQWEKLAVQSTKVSNTANSKKLAELSTIEAKPDEKLAEQLTSEKLAELSTPVSNSVNSVDQTANKKLAEQSTTIKENKESNTKETIQKKDDDDNYSLPEWINQNTWEAFMEVRKKRRSPNTNHAKKLLINELQNLRDQGYDPEEVMNQSIMRGWAGVFPIKNNGDRHASNQRNITGASSSGLRASLGKPTRGN